MAEINVGMDVQDAIECHALASSILRNWDGETGPHVDAVTRFRRRLEAALRSNGWEPQGVGWVRRTGGRTAGRRRR